MRIAGLTRDGCAEFYRRRGIGRDQDVLIATLDTQETCLCRKKGSEGRLMTLPVMKSGQVRW